MFLRKNVKSQPETAGFFAKMEMVAKSGDRAGKAVGKRKLGAVKNFASFGAPEVATRCLLMKSGVKTSFFTLTL